MIAAWVTGPPTDTSATHWLTWADRRRGPERKRHLGPRSDSLPLTKQGPSRHHSTSSNSTGISGRFPWGRHPSLVSPTLHGDSHQQFTGGQPAGDKRGRARSLSLATSSSVSFPGSGPGAHPNKWSAPSFPGAAEQRSCRAMPPLHSLWTSHILS